MVVPPHPDLPRITCSAEFNNLVEHIKRELQVSIVPNFKRFAASSTSSGSPSAANNVINGSASTNTPSPAASTTRESPADTPLDYTFKFRCQRSNHDFLPTAREMLEQFLIKHHVFGYPPTSNAPSGGATTATPPAATTSGSAAGTTGAAGAGAGPSMLHRRTDSFADAFPHFESRVLAGNVGTGSSGSGFGSVLSRARGHGGPSFFS
jgi:hypothetical protein